MYNLFAYILSGTPINEHNTYQVADLMNNPPLTASTEPSVVGYANINSVNNWANYGGITGLNFLEIRNEIVSNYSGRTWGDFSIQEKKNIIDFFGFESSLSSTTKTEIIESLVTGLTLNQFEAETVYNNSKREFNVDSIFINGTGSISATTISLGNSVLNDSITMITGGTFSTSASTLTINTTGDDIDVPILGVNTFMLGLTLGGIYSTTSSVLSQIPENITLPITSDVISGATSVKAKVIVSYNITGGDSSGEMDVFDYTDYVSISGSETSLTDTGNWHNTVSDWIELVPGKVYRIRTRRVGGNPLNTVQVEGVCLILKYE